MRSGCRRRRNCWPARSSPGRPTDMIPRGVSYDEAMRRFRWNVPERFNIGRAVCERHEPNTLAMIVEEADGSVRHWTFGQLLAASSRHANALAARGLRKGDRVAVFLSQGA